MVSIRRKILHKGNIVQEQLLNVLQKHEDALGANATGDSAIADVVGDSKKGLVKDVADLQTAVGALSNYDDSDLKAYIAEIISENNLTDPREDEGTG
jgi:hypothetical protein